MIQKSLLMLTKREGQSRQPFYVMYTFFCLLLLSLLGQAQPILIEGQVLFGETNEPVSNYRVWVYSSVLENGDPIPLQTDESGRFQLETNVDLEPDGGLDSTAVTVEVFDFCTGQAQNLSFDLQAGEEWKFSFSFVICQGFDPPLPPIPCEAFFSYLQTESDPLQIAFTDLSYSNSPIRLYQWDFGDGRQSEEANPIHQYEAPGVYPVTLMIETDSCTNHFFDRNFCYGSN